MIQLSGFRDLYISELQEARSLETILAEALPKMARAASAEELKRAFDDHTGETREHLEVVEAMLRRLDAADTQHVDQSIQSLAQESEKMAGMIEAGPLRDAALIASAQRIEHYEMAVYGTLATYARQLGLPEDEQLLAEILEEERDTDDRLSTIAEGLVNPAAVEEDAKA